MGRSIEKDSSKVKEKDSKVQDFKIQPSRGALDHCSRRSGMKYRRGRGDSFSSKIVPYLGTVNE